MKTFEQFSYDLEAQELSQRREKKTFNKDESDAETARSILNDPSIFKNLSTEEIEYFKKVAGGYVPTPEELQGIETKRNETYQRLQGEAKKRREANKMAPKENIEIEDQEMARSILNDPSILKNLSTEDIDHIKSIAGEDPTPMETIRKDKLNKLSGEQSISGEVLSKTEALLRSRMKSKR